MFSVIFPGQGSQTVGMGKEFYDKFDLVKKIFKEADDTLNLSLSNSSGTDSFTNLTGSVEILYLPKQCGA